MKYINCYVIFECTASFGVDTFESGPQRKVPNVDVLKGIRDKDYKLVLGASLLAHYHDLTQPCRAVKWLWFFFITKVQRILGFVQ